ncbi:hypothetical protein OS42_38160 [Dickeya oryzae]
MSETENLIASSRTFEAVLLEKDEREKKARVAHSGNRVCAGGADDNRADYSATAENHRHRIMVGG